MTKHPFGKTTAQDMADKVAQQDITIDIYRRTMTLALNDVWRGIYRNLQSGAKP